MRVPVYVVTGFLDSGKTTFLNNLLERKEWENKLALVVQFESGDIEFAGREDGAPNIMFPKKMLELQPESIIRELHKLLCSYRFDEIWIEWNGVAPFSQLYTMLLNPALKDFCRIRKVLHIADAAQLESLIGRSGGALLEQIANCDFAVVRATGPRDGSETAKARALLRAVNSGLRVCDARSYKDIYRELSRKKLPSIAVFLASALFSVWLYMFTKPLMEMAGIPINKTVNIFLGIALQAIPFLLIGVHLSSAIEIFASKSAIERLFPKTVGFGMLVSIVAGFFLPVCDCASIPIFRSLVRKGVPLPAAVAFMMAAPVINPVVMLSTYYAFGGNPQVVAERVLLGAVSAILIGVLFSLRQGEKFSYSAWADALTCRCGCYEPLDAVSGFRGKAGRFFRHAQAEFFDVGRYLIVGIFVSSVFQASGVMAFASPRGAGLAISTAVMMFLGFALSLCSSSDAVVARSFAGQFPPGAIMGFLVFGPMMDIKNFMMLSHGFPRSFVVKLLALSFVVCFAVVLTFSVIGGR